MNQKHIQVSNRFWKERLWVESPQLGKVNWKAFEMPDEYFAPLDTAIPSKKLHLTLDTNSPSAYNLKQKYSTSLLGVHKAPAPGP